MNRTIIDGIGDSMKHWSNYIFDVKRGEILNEGSIKYGISEYLVSSENFYKGKSRTIVTGQPEIKDVKFEKIHKLFKNRSVDLNFKVCEGDDKIDVYFEFKYIKNIPLPPDERERYIFDFFRLASLAKSANNEKIDCYFMLVGPPSMAKTLMSLHNEGEVVNGEGRLKINELPNSIHSEIVKCFPRTKDITNHVTLRELLCDGNPYLNRFHEDYKYRDDVNDEVKLSLDNRMNITLKYTTDSPKEKIGVYIWQVNIE